MAVKLRLMRMGKKKQPTYRVVAADSRAPRDGRFIEIVGTYQPRLEPSGINIDNEKALKWLRNGAKPTDTVEKLLEKDSKTGRQPTGAWGWIVAALCGAMVLFGLSVLGMLPERLDESVGASDMNPLELTFTIEPSAISAKISRSRGDRLWMGSGRSAAPARGLRTAPPRCARSAPCPDCRRQTPRCRRARPGTVHGA